MTQDDDVGKKLAQAYAEGLVEGAWRCGEDLLSRAVQRAPVEEGTLRASATIAVEVNGTRFQGRAGKAAAISAARAAVAEGRTLDLSVEVSFNTPYAAVQHERLDFNHPKGGEAKYLERPLLEQATRYGKIMAQSATVQARRARP